MVPEDYGPYVFLRVVLEGISADLFAAPAVTQAYLTALRRMPPVTCALRLNAAGRQAQNRATKPQAKTKRS